MNQTEAMKKLLDQYRFSTVLPRSAYDASFRVSGDVLKKILVAQGSSIILTSMAVKLLFILKKMGITVSLGKCAAIVIAAVIASAGAVTATGYIVIKNISSKNVPASVTGEVSSEKTSSLPVPSSAVKSAVQGVPSPKIEISPFTLQSVDGNEGSRFSNALVRAFVSARGKYFASTGSASAEAPMMLTGSIRKSGDGYMVQARLVDSSNSRVVVMISESARDAEELDKVADRIVAKVLKSM